MSSTFILKNKQGQETDPLSTDTVRTWIREERCRLYTSARRVGDETWSMIGAFAEFSPEKMKEESPHVKDSSESSAAGVQVRVEIDPAAGIFYPHEASGSPIAAAGIPSSAQSISRQTRPPFPLPSVAAAKASAPSQEALPSSEELPQRARTFFFADEDEFEIATWVKVTWIIIIGGWCLLDMRGALGGGDFARLGKVIFSILVRCLIFYGIPKGVARFVWWKSEKSNRFTPVVFLTAFIVVMGASFLVEMFVARLFL